MLLAQGRDHLAIPGPSVIPDRVLRAMHRPSPNIYAGELVKVAASVFRDLKLIAGCSGDVAIYHGNGHAAWEACLCNMFSRGDRILVLVTGRFGDAWLQMARDLGLDAQVLNFGTEVPVVAEKVFEALEADNGHRIKAVLTVQTDTATSSTNDIPAIRRAMNQADHPALLMVDAIASFACEPFHMDAWGVDMLVTACQKGLMTPPGLGILFIGERAWSAHRQADLNTPYWNMLPRVKPSMFPEHFCGTPPTSHLYGLREALDMLLAEGMENVWARHRVMALCVWHAVDVWSEEGDIKCQIAQTYHRSMAVTTIQTALGDASRVRAFCETHLGVTLGMGLSLQASAPPVDQLFRIGHMGHLNPPMLLGTLACIDVAFKHLAIPHGRGALDAATQLISEHATTSRI